jgi:hypothetical protein
MSFYEHPTLIFILIQFLSEGQAGEAWKDQVFFQISGSEKYIKRFCLLVYRGSRNCVLHTRKNEESLAVFLTIDLF